MEETYFKENPQQKQNKKNKISDPNPISYSNQNKMF